MAAHESTRSALNIVLVLAVWLGHPTASRAQIKPEARPSLDVPAIFGGNEFRTEEPAPIQWLVDGTGTLAVEPVEGGKGREIVRRDPATGKREVLVGAGALTPTGSWRPLRIADLAGTRDAGKLLIFTNTRRVWRLETRGDYWVYDREKCSLRKLGGQAPRASLMFARFDPAGRRVAYVRENNLYVEDLSDGKIIRLTVDGSKTLINGTFDWVYEEELALRDGFRWSPDGNAIAYWQIDASGVLEYPLVNNTEGLYPTITMVPYPKTGQKNPSCRVGVVAAAGGPTRWMEVPGDPRQNYIARMDWAGSSYELLIQRLNRRQDTLDLMIGDARTGAVRSILTDRDEAWVDVNDDLNWFDHNRAFTWTVDTGGWRRLQTVRPREPGAPRKTISGDFDVISVVHADEQHKVIYFMASPENPTQAYLYSLPLDGSGAGKPVRVTPASQPGTHGYRISPDGAWAIHSYSSFGRAPIGEIVSLPEHKVARKLTDNAKLQARIDRLPGERGEFFRVDIGDGVTLDGWCIKPPDFDPSRKYPVIVHVYGEPAAQNVLDRWGGDIYLWHRMLAQKGYVVLSVDNRGTPAPRGTAWRKCVYRKVGILAPREQAAAIKALERKWPFLDPQRVGIWGWSGGGSMTLDCMFRYPDLYQAGIAIAFVSDQRYYDTIYQERFMGLPSENAEDYRQGSPITHADGLKGKLLLIHGTGDDNCHYQNFEAMVNRLVALNKPFSMMAYPNRTHAISEGAGTRRHLFELMTRFLEQNLPPGERATVTRGESGGGR